MELKIKVKVDDALHACDVLRFIISQIAQNSQPNLAVLASRLVDSDQTDIGAWMLSNEGGK